MSGRRFSLAALAAALIVVVVLVAYLRIMAAEGDRPVWWAVTILVLGGAGAAYGGVSTSRPARIGLIVAALLLGGLGLLSILSIGLLILVAAALCLLAFVRGVPSAVPDGPTAHP